ncbi:hypothetical protein AX17_007277 [Amanita inopinata Kibby_2008]|nr:hypothetical protein AX17_007277 [Amanita inopinata Kibby_2008]
MQPITASSPVIPAATTSTQLATGITRNESLQQDIDLVLAYIKENNLGPADRTPTITEAIQIVRDHHARVTGAVPHQSQHTAEQLQSGPLPAANPDYATDPKLTTMPPDHVEAENDAERLSNNGSGSPFAGSSGSGESPSEQSCHLFQGNPQPGELEVKYPPEGRVIRNFEGEEVGRHSVPRKWLNEMSDELHERRGQLEQRLKDAEENLGLAALELQKAEIKLEESLQSSRQVLEQVKRLVGTENILPVLRFSGISEADENGKRPGGRLMDLAKEMVQESSGGDDNADADAPMAPPQQATHNEETNHQQSVTDDALSPDPEAAVLSNGTTVEADCIDSTSRLDVESDKQDNTLSAEQSESSEAQAAEATQDRSPLPTATAVNTSPRKRTRDEEDSEDEVETSVLYEIDSGSDLPSPKRRRLDDAGISDGDSSDHQPEEDVQMLDEEQSPLTDEATAVEENAVLSQEENFDGLVVKAEDAEASVSMPDEAASVSYSSSFADNQEDIHNTPETSSGSTSGSIPVAGSASGEVNTSENTVTNPQDAPVTGSNPAEWRVSRPLQRRNNLHRTRAYYQIPLGPRRRPLERTESLILPTGDGFYEYTR